MRQPRQIPETHINQVALSKLENQGDIRVSALRKLLAGMGGRLKLVAEFPEGEVVIDQFEGAVISKQ